MKKVYLGIVAMAVFALSKPAMGQKGFSLTVMATPQFSFLLNDDDDGNRSYDRKATFRTNFGVGSAYNLNSKVGIGLDLLYSLQGQNYEDNRKEFIQKQNYLKIPVYFLYTANIAKPVCFIGKAGPQLSILTNSKLKDGEDNDVVADSEDRYEGATFGGMLGAGAQFKLNQHLFLTTMARVDYDFTNAEDEDSMHWPRSRATTHNATAGIEVGLKFRLH